LSPGSGGTAPAGVTNLTVAYGTRKVLDVPALEVLPGEVLVVIGPNGSGKTTLLLCLALLLKPTTGTVSYLGQPVTGQRQILRLRRRLAVVFQESLLLSNSVWDNVTLGMRLRGIPKNEVKARAQKWLERFGVAHLAKRQARTLSGGEAKRVSLARAFVLEPEVLFLDEPFAALDSPTRQALLEDFEGVLRETKVSTLMVTHDRNEALALADRVAVLIGGTIRQLGTPAEVFNFPVDEEVAVFVEAGNILPGKILSQTAGLAVISTDGKEIEAVSSLPAGMKVTVCLRHEDVTLSLLGAGPLTTSARNRFAGRVTRIFPVGSQVRVTLDCGFPLAALITGRSLEGMGLKEGQEVVATFKASSIHLIGHHLT
jgi:tungstate transport system ATP-binding protein